MNARGAIAGLVLTCASATARANAPAPAMYWIDAAGGGTVTIFLAGTSRACGDGPLLRRNVETGEIVQLSACQDEGAFIDQCVAAGRYQYGLATPLECSRAAGTMYYGEVTLAGDAAASEGCTRTVDAPTPAASVPWGETDVLCRGSYHGPDDYSCSSGGAVMGANLLVLAAGLLLWRRRPARRG